MHLVGLTILFVVATNHLVTLTNKIVTKKIWLQ